MAASTRIRFLFVVWLIVVGLLVFPRFSISQASETTALAPLVNRTNQTALVETGHRYPTESASQILTRLQTTGEPASASCTLNEDFDNVAGLAGAGWSLQNLSTPVGSTGWFQGALHLFDGYSGDGYVAANYQNVWIAGTISNWLLTPVLNIANGDTFSFWTRTNEENTDRPERLEVRLSTAGSSTNVGATNTSVGDFTTVLLTVNPTLVAGVYPQYWTQFTATVSGLATPTTGRVGFRYFVTNGGTGPNSNYIGIDYAQYCSPIVPTATAQPSNCTLNEGFDNVAGLAGAGWSLQNLSTPVGTSGWSQGDFTMFSAYTGVLRSYVNANSNNVSGAGTISNWLLTPMLNLANGDTFSFWTRIPSGTEFPDRLEVRLSTAGGSTNVGATSTSVGDFTTVLLTINPTLVTGVYPQVWTQFTATVAGLTTPTTGRVGFRYFVTNGGTGANSNYIGIDDAKYCPSILATATSTAIVPTATGTIATTTAIVPTATGTIATTTAIVPTITTTATPPTSQQNVYLPLVVK